MSAPPVGVRRTPAVVLAVLSFGVFVAADDLTVVSTMLRQIIFDLGLALPDELDRAAWIVNAYLIGYVVVMPFVGRLSDLLGRRAVFTAAMGLFLVGSIWVPLATSYPAFLAGRVLTALGGGAMVPVGMAVIADLYPPRERASALGILGAIDMAGWVWGPLYGALLIRFLTWRWQFYLNIPLGLIGLLGGWWALAALPQTSGRARIDWAGAALLTGGLLALNVALLGAGDVGAAGGFAAVDSADGFGAGPYYAAAALLLVLFVASQRRPKGGAPPLVDLALLRRPNFFPAVAVNFLVGGILIIAMVNVPLVVNVIEVDVGRAALLSGALLSGLTAAMAVFAFAGGRLTGRRGLRPVLLTGLVLCAAGFGLMGFTWTASTGWGIMAAHLVMLGTGFGLVIAPLGTAVVNAAPDEQRGIAASLAIVMRLIGMSVGLAALTAYGVGRFNTLRTRIILPEIGDPNYASALIEGLTRTTVSVLAETFLISAAVAAGAAAVSLLFSRDA